MSLILLILASLTDPWSHQVSYTGQPLNPKGSLMPQFLEHWHSGTMPGFSVQMLELTSGPHALVTVISAAGCGGDPAEHVPHHAATPPPRHAPTMPPAKCCEYSLGMV